jgi:hypothetical protein
MESSLAVPTSSSLSAWMNHSAELPGAPKDHQYANADNKRQMPAGRGIEYEEDGWGKDCVSNNGKICRRTLLPRHSRYSACGDSQSRDFGEWASSWR